MRILRRLDPVGRIRGVGVGEADPVDHPQVGIDDLEGLLAVGFAGDQIALLGGMRDVPQPIGARRRQLLGPGGQLLLIDAGASLRCGRGAARRREGDRDVVDHTELDFADDPHRPGKMEVNARAQYRDRHPETFVNRPFVEAERGHPGDGPGQDGHDEGERKHRALDEGERPAARQVDAELLRTALFSA